MPNFPSPWLHVVILLVAATVAAAVETPGVVDIAQRGATGDAITDNTAVIQQAIDDCAEQGGVVEVPRGRFLTGGLTLKSHVNLHLAPGATLLGSPHPAAYPRHSSDTTPDGKESLLFADGAEEISVTGNGTIDGQGGSAEFQKGDSGPGRPTLIWFHQCRNVKVLDVTLKNSAFWVQHYSDCDGVVIRGLTVYSHSNFNNDGLDLDCRNAVVSDCVIDTDDDALCFKSTGANACENIVVTNCVLSSNCNAIKMGTGSQTGFKNIAISNCAIATASEELRRHWSKHMKHVLDDRTVLAGIALECVDGGQVDGIAISNITMTGVQTPIFIRLGDRKRNDGRQGSLKNVTIANVVAASRSMTTCSITGIPSSAVENISLSNIEITTPGRGVAADAMRAIPEVEKAYPENRMFGEVLPAAGLYVRHAKNITLNHVAFHIAASDKRPVLVFDDADGVELDGCSATSTAETDLFVQLVNVKNALLSRMNPGTKVKTLIRVEGVASENIRVQDNHSALVEETVNRSTEAPEAAVKVN